MQLAPVMGIAIVLFALSEVLKATVFKDRPDMKAVIPYMCSLVGAAFGMAFFIYDPSILGASDILQAILLGAVSGLIATGSFQIYRQFLNLIKLADDMQESVKTGETLTESDLEHLSNAANAASSTIEDSKKTE